jgi:alpha-1,6-mannosyltransferase
LTTHASLGVDDGRAEWQLALLGAAILGLVLAGPHIHHGLGDVAFNLLGVTHGLLVLWAVVIAERTQNRRALLVILGVAIALRLSLLFVEPHLSTDAYRYVWDGRVQGAGINPYRFVPAAPELAFLRDAEVFPFINRADYAVTIYPPAAQILFYLVGRLSDGLLAMKLAMIAFEAVTVAVLLDLLRRIGRPATRILAYAWHPLAVWEIAGSAHVDAAMVAVMMLGVWVMAVLGRPVLAAAALAVAVLMKPLAALVLPFAWKPWDWRAPTAALAVILLLYIPYLSVGSGIFAFVPGYLQEEQIEGGEGFWAVWLVTRLIGPLPLAKSLYLAAVAALLAALAVRLCLGDGGPEARLRSLSWLVFAGIFALSPNYPWYYLAVVPFIALFGTPPFWAASIACYLLYEEIWVGPHIAFWIRDTAMQVSVLAALLLTLRLRHGRRPASALLHVEDPAR